MQPHTLDPLLLSPNICDEQRKFMLFSEIGHLSWECNAVYAIIRGDHGKPGPEAYQRFVSAADQAQQLILLSKALFGTAEAMNEFLNTFSLRQSTSTQEGNERGYYLSIAGAALMHESPAFSQTCAWLRQWFKVDAHASSSNRLPNLRFQIGKVKVHFDNIQPGLYEQPRFYANNEFRNLTFHRFFFSEVVAQQFHEIADDVRRNADAADFWFNKVSEADKGIEPGKTIRAELASQLRKLPVDGLWGLRKLILGKAQPSGEECSSRLANILTIAVHYELHEEAIKALSDNVTALSHNCDFMDNVMLEDVCDFFKSDLATYSDESNHSFDGSPTKISQISKALEALDLNQESLAYMAMSTIADYSRGKMRDLKSLSVREQLKSVMVSVHQSGRLAAKPEDLRYALLAAIIRNLPDKLVEQMASVSDLARSTCYEMTGNANVLQGIKDAKLRDSILGKDLGL